MRTRTIQTNFTAGELSPRLLGRVDIAKYHNGLALLENAMVMPHGGAVRRPGLRFVAEAKYPDKKARLIPFQFSTEQAYILEFGDQYIRFYMNQGQIQAAGSPYEIASPYLEAELADLKFTQSADVMYIVHPNHEPRKLTRTGHTSWTLSVVSFTSTPAEWSAGNYPSVVTFFEERLVIGATPNEPQTLWFSKSGSYEDLTIGTSDDDAMKLTLASDQVNAIQWLVPAKVLHVGTTGGEWTLSSGALGQPLTPTNLQAKREGTHGSAGIQALQLQNQVTFVQRARRKVYRRQYSYEADGYLSDELTLLAEHITGSGLTYMAYQPAQDPILWAIRADGLLVGMSYLGGQDVIAWHRHTTDGNFESVAVIPAASRDETWVLVKREISGTTRRYVEFMEDPQLTTLEDAFFVDSGLSYEGAPVTTISGLDHLEGKTVAVLADGATHPECTVQAGKITLQRAAAKVHVGLSYQTMIKTLPAVLEALPAGGQGQVKRIHRIAVRFYQTVGAKIGRDLNHLDIIPFRTTSDPMDTAVPLFTGDKVIDFAGDYDTQGVLYIVQDQPLPMTVLAIITELGVGD